MADSRLDRELDRLLADSPPFSRKLSRQLDRAQAQEDAARQRGDLAMAERFAALRRKLERDAFRRVRRTS